MDLQWRFLSPLLFVFLVAVDAQTINAPSINLTVTDVGTDTFTVSWDDVPDRGYTGYKMYLAYNNGTEKVSIVPAVNGTNLNQVITKLNPGELHGIAIYGIQGGNEDPLGDVLQYTVPLPPNNVIYKTVEGTQNIEVAWTPPESEFNKYVIKYTVDGVPKRQTVDKSESNYTIANLGDGKTAAGLTVSSGAGTHDDHLVESTPVEARSLDPSINLTVTDVGTNTFTVSWDDISKWGYTGYIIYLTHVNGTESDITVPAVNGTKPAQVIANLQPGQIHDIAIYGVPNGNQLGDVIQYTAPLPPNNVTYKKAEGTQNIEVAWNQPDGEPDQYWYVIKYTVDGVPNKQIADKYDSNYTITGLEDGKTVAGLMVSSGAGTHQDHLVESTPVVARSLDSGPPNINLTVIEVGTNTFTVSWEDISNQGYTGYMISLTDVDGKKHDHPVPAVSGTKPTQVIGERKPGQRHVIEIFGIPIGNGDPLGKVIQYTAPLPPSDVTYKNVEGTQNIEVTWKHPEGEFNKFFIKYTVDGVLKMQTVDKSESKYTIADLGEGKTVAGLKVSSVAGMEDDHLVESTPVEARSLEPDIHQAVTGVGTNNFTLSWDDISSLGYTNYTIKFNGDGDQDDITLPAVAGKKPSNVITALQPGHRYDITIFGIKNGEEILLRKFIQYTAPLPPSHVTYMNVKDTNSFEVMWMEPQGSFDKYLIKYTVAGANQQQVVDKLESSYVIADLGKGKTVEKLTVSSVAGTDPDQLVESEPIEAVLTVPAVINLQVTEVGTNSFKLSWDEVSDRGYTGYAILVTQGEDELPDVIVPAVKGTKPTKAVTKLQPGQRYEIDIVGIQNDEQIVPLADKIQYTAPMPPSDVSYRNVGDAGNVEVLWTEPGSEFDHYVIKYALDGVESKQKVNKSESSYTFTNLKKGSQIVILTVYSVAGTVESTPAMPRSLDGPKPIAPPPPPSNATVIQPNGTKNLVVTWTPPGGVVNKYHIVYSVDGEPKRQEVDGKESSFTFSDLKEGQVVVIETVSSVVGSGPGNIVESTPIEVRRVGETDYGSPGRAGHSITPISLLKLVMATTAVTVALFI